MSFRIMGTVTAVIMAACANCGCSAVPSWVQAQNTYDSAGPAARARVPTGSYGSVNGYSTAVDLAACAHSREQPNRLDQLCNRQDGNPYGSN